MNDDFPRMIGQGVGIMLAILLVIVGVVDCYIILFHTPEDTVSAFVKRWSHDFPLIPLGAGMLIGHLFL